MPRPIAISVGDPRGIGPEIIGKALGEPSVAALGPFVIVGAEGVGVDVNVSVGQWTSGASSVADAGRLAGLAIERAVAMARAGEVSGIVTAPIDKAALLAGGYAGYAVSWIGIDSDLASQRMWRSAAAALAGVAVVVTSLLLERACRVRSDPDDA